MSIAAVYHQPSVLRADAWGFAEWGRDLHRPSTVGLTGCLHLVVMIYFWDVAPEGGATAVVPRSHRFEDLAIDHGFGPSRLEQVCTLPSVPTVLYQVL